MNGLENQDVRQQISTMRIVVAVMVASVLVYATVVVWLDQAPEPGFDILLTALAVVAVSSGVAYPVLRQATLQKMRQERARTGAEGGKLLGGYLTLTLIGCAMAETVALFGVTVYLLIAHVAALVVVALAVLALLRLMPSTAGFQDFDARTRG